MLVAQKPGVMVPFPAEELFSSPEHSDRLGDPHSFIFSEYRQ